MDRNLYKSDKKLAEQGWRSMRRALDREMPEPRRRRPVALIWILGLLLPTAGGLAWMLFGPGHPGQLPQIENTPVAVAPQRPVRLPDAKITPLSGTNTSLPSSKSPAKAAPTQTLTPTPKSNPAKASILVAALEDQPAPGQLVYTQTMPPAGASDEQAGISAVPLDHPSETGPAVTPDALAAASGSSSENSDIAANPSTSVQTDDNSSLTKTVQPETSPEPSNAANIENPVPGQPGMEYAATDPAANPSPQVDPGSETNPLVVSAIQPVKSTVASKWSVGATTGVLSNASVSYAGATAGLSTTWQPNRKWGVRSGLAYQYQPLPSEERPVVSITSATYVESTGDFKIYANITTSGFNAADEAAAPVFVPVARLHRLELPLLAFYQPASRLRLFGGVSVGANVYAEAGDRSLRNNTVFDIQADNNNLDQEVSGKVRNLDFQGGAGLGFLPLKHLEVDLFYFHRLTATGKNTFSSSGLYDTQGATSDPAKVQQAASQTGISSMFQLVATWFF